MRVTLVPNFQLEYSIQLANGLTEFVDVTLVVWDGLAPELIGLVDRRVTLFRCGNPGQMVGQRIVNEARISLFLRADCCDVVHFQNAYIWRVPVLAALRRKKCVVTIHDPRPHFGLADPWSFLATAMHSIRADALVTLGPRQRELFLTRFNVEPRNVFVIPHGEFSFLNQFASESSSGEPTVLFIGRIAPYKGLDYFLRSIPRIAQRVPTSRFRIVGAGDIRPYRSLIQDATRLEIENVAVTVEQVAREIGRATVIVVPYVEASQSGVVVAAQSLGRPVVVSDVGGLSDDVLPDETAVLVRPKDPAAIADAVVSLLEDPKRREAMARRAKEWMTTSRSWRSIARSTVGLYEALT